MIKHPLLKFLFGIVIAIIFALFLFFVFGSTVISRQSSTKVITPAPTMTQKTTTNSIDSADGSMKLVMKSQDQADGSRAYSFFIQDKNNNQKLLFAKKESGSTLLSIPFNAWSPDGKYVWIEEDTDGMKNSFVFQSSGDAFSDGEQYYDVRGTFTKKNTGNIYNQATGWASETLLIVDTTTLDGNTGPSYWFEIPSQAIIQLSTQF